jgi:hypothetical protein
MHRNPVERGLVAEPEQWEWSSYRSYAFEEVGAVKMNQWPAAVMKIRAWLSCKQHEGESIECPPFAKNCPVTKNAKDGPP